MDDTEALYANILSLGDWATWKDCIDKVEDSIQSWVSRIDVGLFHNIVLVGCGSSYYAGQVGKYILEHLVQRPVDTKQAFSFSHYSSPSLLGEDVLVVGVSSTGNTQATCTALAHARQHGAATLAITAAPGSKITQIAHDTIWIGGGDNTIVKTRSYVQSLVALYYMALELARKTSRLAPGGREYWQDQIRLVYEVTHQFLDAQQTSILDLVEEYQSAAHIFILGAGPNVGTAEEAALKVIEMAKLYSDGCDMEEFFHGRDRELEKGSKVFFLAPQNSVVERMLDFLAFTRKVDVPTVVLTGNEIPELDQLTGREIFLQRGLVELATPLAYITPLYLFGYHLALKRGFAPNARRFPMGALYVHYRGSEYDKSNVNS
jgi:glucosamine--fructose-6-phosphate aminotransferase (isomerizing)